MANVPERAKRPVRRSTVSALSAAGSAAGGALLLRSIRAKGGRRVALAGIGGASLAGAALAKVLERRTVLTHPSAQRSRMREAIAQRSVTIACAPSEVYALWSDPTRFADFMQHVEAVEALGEGRSRWTIRGPFGLRATWLAEVTEMRQDELIAWRTVDAGDGGIAIETEGRVHFRPAPGNRGTEVHVQMRYSAPAGSVGRALAKLVGKEPDLQLRADLRRLEQILEAGEIPTNATLAEQASPA